jgi:iron complex transport system substrate-binding protein
LSIAIALTLLMAACRGSDDAEGEPTPADTEPAASAEEAVFPREITHLGDPFALDEQPQNVIALGFSMTDVVAGLGVTPVGAFTNSDQEPFGTHTPLTEFEEEIPSVGHFEINLEVIASLQPDLIVALSWIEGFKGYDEMQKVAPVMVLDPEDHWRVWLEEVGYALGLEDTATQVLADFDAHAAEVDELIPDGTEVALVSPEDNGAAEIQGPDSAAGQIATDAGLEVLTVEEGAIDWSGEEGGAVVWTALSKERLDEITSPTMIVLTFEEKQFEEVENDPLWTALPAFQNDAVYVVDDGEAWFQPGPLGANFALDQIAEFYAA